MAGVTTSSSGLSRLVLFGPVVGAATVARTGQAWAKMWLEHGPGLIDLGLQGWRPTSDSDDARRAMRRRLIEVGMQSVNLAYEQASKGISDLDSFTTPD
jgi:hypothetical protein